MRFHGPFRYRHVSWWNSYGCYVEGGHGVGMDFHDLPWTAIEVSS